MITSLETFITQANETATLPNSYQLLAGSGLSLTHGTNTVTFSFTGNVSALNSVGTNGICVLTAPSTMTTRVFDSTTTINWNINGMGNYQANFLPASSNQNVNILLNGVPLGNTWPTINLISGSSGSVNAVSNSGAQRYDVTIAFNDTNLTDAHFLIATADGDLPDAVNLGLLSSGYLYGTVSSATSTISSVATIPINQGGTGQTTAGAAFTALSPSISYLGGTLCIGSPENVLGYAICLDAGASTASMWMGASGGLDPNPEQGGIYAINDEHYPYFQNPAGVFEFILAINGDVDPGTLNSLLVGDVVAGNAAVYKPIPAGAANEVLSMNDDATAIVWSAPTFLTNPMTTAGDLIMGGIEGTPERLPIGATGQVLSVSAGVPSWQNGLTNPMTTAGDLIYGGASGVPTRLAATTNGDVLTLVNGNPVWSYENSFVNPMTSVSDMIVGGTVVGGISTPTRLAAGSANQILSMDDMGVDITWIDSLTNPMTELGDMIIGGASGVPERLPIVSSINGEILTIVDGAQSWVGNIWYKIQAGGSSIIEGGLKEVTIPGQSGNSVAVGAYMNLTDNTATVPPQITPSEGVITIAATIHGTPTVAWFSFIPFNNISLGVSL